MRIYGNRQLKTLPGQATRPTTARVREAVFNIWQGKINNSYWLDLCAGNGSMGAEALCRGAKKAVAIESSARACHIIRQNWSQVTTPKQTFQVIRGDVKAKIHNLAGEKFDYIYFDPPYASDLYEPVLTAIAKLQLLSPIGKIAVEHNDKMWSAQNIPGLQISRTKVYGNTSLTIYWAENVEDFSEKN
ncbi:MAG: 16S rRNA (guanine(966)-N(2))-methyltransferase RsmD [Cyanobacteria bacterium J083]|nr:MAG: 16S rRNA (guanine(966)-N(2))-methyltransferase RsmD [Cyanobacteria bacterium J083]